MHSRHSTPAEVLLRLLVVQHLSAWSYQETVDQVADSMMLRWFCRVYLHHVPDKTTLLRWAATIRPETLHALTDRAARLAQHAQFTRARKLRIDSTCVQTTIQHPTDTSLLRDGVRVLTLLIQRAKPLVHEHVTAVRDAFRSRLRTVRPLLRQIHRVSRRRGEVAAEHLCARYAHVLETTCQMMRQAERVQTALATAPDVDGAQQWQASARSGASAAEPVLRRAHGLQTRLTQVLPLARRVMVAACTRVLAGQSVPAREQVLSLFEPHMRVVQRAKAGALVEFVRQVVFDEVEGELVTRFPSSSTRSVNATKLCRRCSTTWRRLGTRPGW